MGDIKTARLMAKRNIDILSKFDHIVTGCASCGAALKDYKDWFSEDTSFQEKALDFSKKISDFSEFLVNAEFRPECRLSTGLKVTYHDPCYLNLHQNICSHPRKLLNALDGIQYIEMEGADACCGNGSFGITHTDIGGVIQSKKMESIKKTGADIVVTSCPGCMMNLFNGIQKNKLPVNVLHISQLIKYQAR